MTEDEPIRVAPEAVLHQLAEALAVGVRFCSQVLATTGLPPGGIDQARAILEAQRQCLAQVVDFGDLLGLVSLKLNELINPSASPGHQQN